MKPETDEPKPPRIPTVGEDLGAGDTKFWKPSENPHEGDMDPELSADCAGDCPECE